MSLENAPDDVKLAVDLIVLLEENQIPARTVLRALDIVKRDYEKKLQSDETPRFKTAWVLVPFPYFRNTGFCISYF